MRLNFNLLLALCSFPFFLISCGGGDTASKIQQLQDKNSKAEEKLLEADQKVADLEKRLKALESGQLLKSNAETSKTAAQLNNQVEIHKRISVLEEQSAIQRKQYSELRNQMQANQRSIHNQIANIQRSSIMQRKTSTAQSDNPQLNKTIETEKQRMRLVNMISSWINTHSLPNIAKMLNARNIRTLKGGPWDDNEVLKFIRENRITRKRPTTNTTSGN